MPDQESSKTPQDRYYTIGEVSALCEVKQHVLRYWETQFSPLQNLTRLKGRRYYTKTDIEFIHQLKDLLYVRGFTISGAQKYLSAKPSENKNKEPDQAPQPSIKEAIEQLQNAKQLLKEITFD